MSCVPNVIGSDYRDESELSSQDEDDNTYKGKRRMFDVKLDLMLLTEIQKIEAHLCNRGTRFERFAKVADNLNASGKVPWRTDGKHCDDRFKLIKKKHKRGLNYRIRRRGDNLVRFNLCAQMIEQERDHVKKNTQKRTEEEERRSERNERASELRYRAMNRLSSTDPIYSEDGDNSDVTQTPD